MSPTDLLLEKLGVDVPIVQAPMGGAAGPELAAAVSNAGALGSLPLWAADAAAMRGAIGAVRALSSRPFMVNLNVTTPQEERLALCLDEGVPVISFFWGEAPELVERARLAGATVMQVVASAREARQAVECGADIVVAQGWEAGGHVRGMTATMALVPAVADAVGRTPVVAAGGIADGRGVAAALALGAAGVWVGTRFLAAREAAIHPEYRRRVIAAGESDTVWLETLFDGGWPDAPHRVLRNSTVEAWEAAGRPPPGMRPREGEVVARSESRGDIRRYESVTPRADAQGDVEAMPLWAGQGVGLACQAMAAADIVREMQEDARSVLRRLTL